MALTPCDSEFSHIVPMIVHCCHFSLFNKQLEKDTEQRQAVQHIVAGTSKPAAYILFGPPGTGTAAYFQQLPIFLIILTNNKLYSH